MSTDNSYPKIYSANPSDQKRLEQVKSEIDSVIVSMNSNIQKATLRGQNLETLQQKSDDLSNEATLFQVNASKAQKKMFWENRKKSIMIGCCIFLIVIVVIRINNFRWF